MSADLDRARLAKLLGMLGGADGEILNAARAVEKLRRGAKLSWQEILTGGVSPSREDPALRRQVGELLAENDRLWDRVRGLEAQLKAAEDDSHLRRHVDALREMLSRRDQQIHALEAKNEALRKASFALPPDDLGDVLCLVMTWKHHLNEWERGFIDDLVRRRKRQLLPKESTTLSSILDKINLYRRHAGNGRDDHAPQQ
jgi:hypothetical protein